MKNIFLVCAGWALAAQAAAAPVRLMTFNLRYDNRGDGANRWELRRDAVGAFLSERQPDIVGVQEALRGQLDDLRARLPGYEEVGVGRDDGKTRGEYSALLVRTSRFAVVESGTFWLSDTPETPGSRSWGNDIPRICTRVSLRDEAGGRLTVFNAHFDHVSQPSREKSAALIRDRAAAVEGPCVLMGDWNATSVNPAVKVLLMAGWRDAFVLAAPAGDPGGTFHAFHGGGDGPRIDHLLVRDPVKVRSYRIHREPVSGRVLSDHHPVAMEIEWPVK